MGTWAIEPFGNDTACDWACDLANEQGFGFIDQSLQAVFDADGYLDTDLACQAVAAAEVLAKIIGRGTPSDAGTDEVDAWVASAAKPDAALLAKARKALDRVLADDSELRDLWQEADDGEAWTSAMHTLRDSLAA